LGTRGHLEKRNASRVVVS